MSFGSYDPEKRGRNFEKTKRFYLKDGSNIFRVLPPAKSLENSNKLGQFWSILWLTDTRGKKRPVSSILRKNKETILQHDAIVTKLDEMKKELEVAYATKQNPATIGALKENLKRIMHKKFYALNVIDASGNLGVLEVPYTAYQNLEQRIRELRTMGLDAVGIGSDKGIFFDFKKLKDERGRTVYPVDPHMRADKDAGGNWTMSYVRLPITNEEAALLAEKVEDLTKLYRELPVDQHNALATLDQRVFDAVFAKPTDADEEPVDLTDEESQSQFGQQVVTQQASGFAQPGPQAFAQQPLQPAPQYQTTPTAPTATVQQQVAQSPQINLHGQGSVLNNQAVKNFLFPDTGKKS